MKNEDFDSLLVEIFEGFSVFESSIGKVYFKHFSFIDSKKVSQKKTFFLNEALKRGLPREKEIVDSLISDGVWDKESEKFIQDKRLFIENLKKSLSKIQIPSQRENHRKLITMEEERLAQKENDRKSLIGVTAEAYSESKSNSDFLSSFMYIDNNFTKLIVDELEENSTIFNKEIQNLQLKFFEKFSDSNISRLILSDSFSPIFQYIENPEMLFGKKIFELTAFQMKTCSYGRSFLNIFKNATKEIPDYVAKDPDLLIEFYESQKHDSKKQTKARQGEGGTTYFGANRRDINALASDDEKPVSLSEEIKKRGGKLDMQEMMKLHGV